MKHVPQEATLRIYPICMHIDELYDRIHNVLCQAWNCDPRQSGHVKKHLKDLKDHDEVLVQFHVSALFVTHCRIAKWLPLC